MHGFVSVRDPRRGEWTGFVRDGRVVDVTEVAGADVLGFVRDGRINSAEFLDAVMARAADRAVPGVDYQAIHARLSSADGPTFGIPYVPPEVWGVGVSYRRIADLHEADMRASGRNEGLYAYVFESVRPEIFFKGTGRHCVGHNDYFTIRGDSEETIVEAELACIFDETGEIAAFTIANDITAWDIEKESPLFLSYAKIFEGSCVLGPVLVPAALLPDPLALRVRCVVTRQGETIYDGEGNTRHMKRSLEELRRYLLYCNRVPGGTVLCTGTAVGVPSGFGLTDGDVVRIDIERLGQLCAVARHGPYHTSRS